MGTKVITGFMVGTIFVPCTDHQGSVALLPTLSGKGCGYRLVSTCGDYGEYHEDYFGLELRSFSTPVGDDEVFRVAASRGVRLVVTQLTITEHHGKISLFR